MEDQPQTVTYTVGGTRRGTFYPYCKMDKMPTELRYDVPTREDIEQSTSGSRIPIFRTICWACEGPGSLQCEKCKVGRYCSKECQKSDWKLHKRYCHENKFSHPGSPCMEMDH